MNTRNLTAGLLTVLTLGTMAVTPIPANAQRGWDHRDTDRDWRSRDRRDREGRDGDWRSRDRTDWRSRASDRRQDTKNEWRNIAIGSGALGVLGLLSKDNTLAFAGSAGALYSLYRYEEDRKSQSRLNRARAAYFSRPYFYRDGERFERVTLTRNGKRFYRFVRG